MESKARRFGPRRVAAAIARRLRRAPVPADKVRAARDAAYRRVLASGLFDLDYYAAQGGDAGSLERAVADFIDRGEAAGLSPHPLIEPEWLQRHLKKPRAHGFARWLDGGRVESPHPLLAAGESLDGHDDVRERAYAWAREVAAGGSAPDPIDWAAAAAKPRDPAIVSMLIPVHEDWKLTIQAIAAVLATSDDTELVLIDHGSRRAVGAIIQALYGDEPRVSYRRIPSATSTAVAADLALVASRGERVVFMTQDAAPRPGWEVPLLAALDDPAVRGAGPLVLGRDGTVRSAGVLLHGPAERPTHALAGHPAEDARGEARDVPAVSGTFLACRASEAIAVAGLDVAVEPELAAVDLALRLSGRFGGGFRLVTDAVVVADATVDFGDATAFLERWGDSLPVSAAPELRTRTATRLRWAIKNPAPAGDRGDAWGDTFFADDLARGLRSLGQEVVIDRREAHERSTAHLDDVVIGLRGLRRIRPHAGAINVLWIISHPELIEAGELEEFDLVFAASANWGADRGVRPLLQATDPDRFHPGAAAPDLAADVLFVGRPRGGVFRPIVRDAIAAGADLAVYGDTWERFIDPAYVRAQHLDNARLPEAYRSARVVLNDHWAHMAELGFVSNRLFDAAATGARIVTDDVAGLDALFGGLARAYSSVDELRMLLSPETDWPDSDARAAIAARVGAEHSFAARALVLLDDVLALRSSRPAPRD